MKLDRKHTHTELIFSLDEVAVFVPPYSKREIQSVQAKRELRSRLRCVFSKQERSRRAKLKITPFGGNPHVISDLIAKTDNLPAGSLTQKILLPVSAANFADHQSPAEVIKKARGELRKDRKQRNLKSWSVTLDSLLRSKSGLVFSLLSLIILTAYSKDQLSNAYMAAKKVLSEQAEVKIKPIAVVQAAPTVSDSPAEKETDKVAEVVTTTSAPEKMNGQHVVSKTAHQPTVKLVKTEEKQTAPSKSQKVTERAPLPLPGLPIGPIPESNAQQYQAPSAPAAVKSPERSDQKSSSVALTGDLDTPKEHTSPTSFSATKAVAIHQATPAIKQLRWGSSSGLIAFSAKGVIALDHGQQVEVLPGEKLPNGKTLKAINQDSSVIVTSEGSILMK